MLDNQSIKKLVRKDTLKLVITFISGVLLSSSISWGQVMAAPVEIHRWVESHYLNTSIDRGWTPGEQDPRTWDSAPPTFPAQDFSRAETMDLFFIGKDADFVNSLGISWVSGDAEGSSSTPPQTVFAEPFHPGYTVRFDLYANRELGLPDETRPSAFDFYLDSSRTDWGGPTGGFEILSGSGDQDYPQVRSTVELVDGVNYYLYSFEYVNATDGFDEELDHEDYSDFIFGVVFNSRDGIPLTGVPEPSTYGVMAVVSLLCLIGYRKVRGSRRPAV